MNEEQKNINDGDLAKCQAQLEEYLAGWKRAKADLVNFQKDEAKRFEDVVKFSNKEFIKDAITVLDSLDLAIASSGDKGLEIIRNQFGDILKKHGVEEMAVRVGEAFDAACHEALMAVDSGGPPDTVAEVIEKGYTLHGRVVRPSRVKISK
mgnify:CR=1 FL=1